MMMVPLDYPSGAPGLALVLMRLSLSALLLAILAGCSAGPSGFTILAAALACLIAGGFCTRLAASLFALVGVLLVAVGAVSPAFAPLTVEGIALALLGPGAWSIDAWARQSGLVTLRDWPRHGR